MSLEQIYLFLDKNLLILSSALENSTTHITIFCTPLLESSHWDNIYFEVAFLHILQLHVRKSLLKYTGTNRQECYFEKVSPYYVKWLAGRYRLFFLRSIAQFFTQIYMNCFISIQVEQTG